MYLYIYIICILIVYLISKYFLCLFSRFKGSHLDLTKYINSLLLNVQITISKINESLNKDLKEFSVWLNPDK